MSTTECNLDKVSELKHPTLPKLLLCRGFFPHKFSKNFRNNYFPKHLWTAALNDVSTKYQITFNKTFDDKTA